MGAAFLITLREGLEASLILAILVTYLVRTGRRSAVRQVWIGSAAAAIGVTAVGLLVNAAVGGLNGKVEQAVEGTIALTACVVLTWMIFWMRRNARSLGGELRLRLDGATSAFAVVVIAFTAVAREGLETVLFLLSAETDSGDASGARVVIGGLIGLAVAAVLGVLVYLGGSHINLKMFFNITGLLLILFAAGLAGKAAHEFRELLGFESGWLIEPAWTVASGPLASGNFFDFLKGFFGWSADPERIRVIAYFAYLIPVLYLYLRRPSTPPVKDNPDSDTELANVAASH